MKTYLVAMLGEVSVVEPPRQIWLRVCSMGDALHHRWFASLKNVFYCAVNPVYGHVVRWHWKQNGVISEMYNTS
jgi:hypothetical protein